MFSLPHPLAGHKSPHRGEFGFSPQNDITPPPKGGGAGYRLFGSLEFSCREARRFSAGKDGCFISEGFSRQLPVATAGLNWPTRLQRALFGASLVFVPLPDSQNRTQGHTGPSLDFLPRTGLPLPLKGEGRNFAHLWGFGFSLAVAFGNRWPQLAHTGPTGRVCCFSGVVPLPGSHNRTQGRIWFHRLFLVCFFCGSPASWRSRW